MTWVLAEISTGTRLSTGGGSAPYGDAASAARLLPAMNYMAHNAVSGAGTASAGLPSYAGDNNGE